MASHLMQPSCSLFLAHIGSCRRHHWMPGCYVQVFKHTLGSDPTDDELVFHETDDSFYVGLGESRSRDYICVSSGAPPLTPPPPHSHNRLS